ncbi:MAG: P22 phage major capsid protein family protein [Phenylobacterium sp.]|uniref:P22 phage major capsid protein family protein n=1 Tax=Phenylobacterium sp. TaxID=1871053 RepID=UPI00391B740D
MRLARPRRMRPQPRTATNPQAEVALSAAHCLRFQSRACELDGTADGSGNLTVAISPAIVTAGATQNVSGSPADNAAITVAGTASTPHGISMAYHKGAFAFASADMVMPRGVDFAAREVFDGVSMRIVRQYDINNDKFPCRLDVLYGYQTLRPQLACRLANN